MRATLFAALAALLVAGGDAHAFNGTTSSDGEASAVMIGEYNCTGGSTTRLTLTNGDPLRGYCACVQVQTRTNGFFVEFEGLVDVRELDSDSINLCSLMPNTAGRVEVVQFRAPGVTNNCNSFKNNPVEGGLYGWTSESAGGNSELRVVPNGVEDKFLARNLCAATSFMLNAVPQAAFVNGTYE